MNRIDEALRAPAQVVFVEVPDGLDRIEVSRCRSAGASTIGLGDYVAEPGDVVVDMCAQNPGGELEGRIVAACRTGRVRVVITGVAPTSGTGAICDDVVAMVTRARRSADLTRWFDPTLHTVSDEPEVPR